MKKSSTALTRFFVIWILIFGFAAGGASADSIWKKDSVSPYSSQKPRAVGDLIEVDIMESSTAKTKANTDTSVKDDLAAKFSHNIARLTKVIPTNPQVSGNLSNKYSGAGQTTRGNTVTARITAWVTEILPNGNLAIKGQHKVEVNDELQEITITGIVRSKDISPTNIIYSYQVANANLSVKGTGPVSDTESPGWLTRVFNWLF